MANLILAPLSHNKRTRALQAKRARRENPALYKKEWMSGNNVLEDNSTGVEWRGWLYEEGQGPRGDKEVGIGWCNKGNHYIAWHLRHGHLAECIWRNGRLYGK